MADRAVSRSVLVTGGSRGVGRACAHAFAALGDRVAVHYGRNGDLADEVVAELPGSGHLAVGGDVSDPDAVRRFVDAAADGLGSLDVVVNNAGVFFDHPVTEVTYEQWQEAWATTIGINLIGPANVAWCAAHRMIEQGRGGRIVAVSSRGAFRGERRAPAYGASKAGLNALTQSLALVLGAHGIALSAVAPGFIETEMAQPTLNGPRGPEVRGQSPFDRVARPEEVAAAVVYLASADAEWASGAILDFNGASYLRT